MTDIDLLREAATKMRARAQAATPGPWSVEKDDLWIKIQSASVPGWQGEIADVHTPDEAWPDYDHIAAFASPTVALAVADWLDHEATKAGNLLPQWKKQWNGDPVVIAALTDGVLRHALTVARAYLGRNDAEVA